MNDSTRTLQVAAAAIKSDIRGLEVAALDALLAAQDAVSKAIARGEAPLLSGAKRSVEEVGFKATAIINAIIDYEKARSA